MSDVKWAPDGKKMFEKLLGAVPEAMREMAKPQLLKFLAARASGKAVTAQVVTRMVKEDLPEPQKGMIMQALGIKKPAGKKAEKEKVHPASAGEASQPQSQETWEGSSRSMFERMIKEVPEALQEVFRGKLMDILRQKARGGPYRESSVTEIVNEIVPEPFKSNILKAFATMGGVDVGVVEGIIASFPGGPESVSAILHSLKNKFGYVPEEALRVVSQKKGVFMSALYRLVTSFQAFPTASPKKHTVSICTGTGCHLKGSGAMLKKLEGSAAAPDVPVTLEKVRCLGCCDLSPAVVVDGEVYGGTDAQEKISEMLGE